MEIWLCYVVQITIFIWLQLKDMIDCLDVLGNPLNIKENNNEGFILHWVLCLISFGDLRQLSRYDKKVFDRIGCSLCYGGVYT